jgi:hypothetical protein
MRILIATIFGVMVANAGFAAVLVATILLSHLTGTAHSPITVGFAMALLAILTSFVIVLRGLGRLRYAVLLSH